MRRRAPRPLLLKGPRLHAPLKWERTALPEVDDALVGHRGVAVGPRRALLVGRNAWELRLEEQPLAGC
ncbi:MAG: hypothetical protein AMXMBFR34_09900 [Myxococcaceae bacterium]